MSKIVIGGVNAISWLPPIGGCTEGGENCWERNLSIFTVNGVVNIKLQGDRPDKLLSELERGVRAVATAELNPKEVAPF